MIDMIDRDTAIMAPVTKNNVPVDRSTKNLASPSTFVRIFPIPIKILTILSTNASRFGRFLSPTVYKVSL